MLIFDTNGKPVAAISSAYRTKILVYRYWTISSFSLWWSTAATMYLRNNYTLVYNIRKTHLSAPRGICVPIMISAYICTHTNLYIFTGIIANVQIWIRSLLCIVYIYIFRPYYYYYLLIRRWILYALWSRFCFPTAVPCQDFDISYTRVCILWYNNTRGAVYIRVYIYAYISIRCTMQTAFYIILLRMSSSNGGRESEWLIGYWKETTAETRILCIRIYLFIYTILCTLLRYYYCYIIIYRRLRMRAKGGGPEVKKIKILFT